MARELAMPSTATALGVLGMVAYPVCVVGLAVTLGGQYGPLWGWLVAAAGSAAAAFPKANADLEARAEDRRAATQARLAGWRTGAPTPPPPVPLPAPPPVQAWIDAPVDTPGG